MTPPTFKECEVTGTRRVLSLHGYVKLNTYAVPPIGEPILDIRTLRKGASFSLSAAASMFDTDVLTISGMERGSHYPVEGWSVIADAYAEQDPDAWTEF